MGGNILVGLNLTIHYTHRTHRKKTTTTTIIIIIITTTTTTTTLWAFLFPPWFHPLAALARMPYPMSSTPSLLSLRVALWIWHLSILTATFATSIHRRYCPSTVSQANYKHHWGWGCHFHHWYTFSSSCPSKTSQLLQLGSSHGLCPRPSLAYFFCPWF